MRFRIWTILALGILLGGWLAFDGSRAFLTGDYVTPKAGPYAGRLGPWSQLVSALGFNPRGAFMKSIHLVLGLFWLAGCACLAHRVPAGWWILMGCSFATLWYLPSGTLIGLIEIILLWITRPR